MTATFRSRSIAVLGPNGSGKSTLFRVLSTLARPTSGSFAVHGLTPNSPTTVERHRRELGVLPQSLGMMGGYTCAEFLRYVCWLRRVPAAQTESAIDAALDSVDLSDRAPVPIKRLSGGMRQRLGLAQALVSRPKLLLLDEPTVGLDPRQRAEFRVLLRRLPDDCTLILATHLVDDVAAVADEVLVLDHGARQYAGPLAAMCETAPGRVINGADVEAAYLRLVPAAEE